MTTRPVHNESRAPKRRLVASRPAGIPKHSDAPFWRGERMEHIVAARIERQLAEAAAKKANRKTRIAPDGTRIRSPKTPHQRLRRLERALTRRKTLAAQQRVRAQIAQLRRELGLD